MSSLFSSSMILSALVVYTTWIYHMSYLLAGFSPLIQTTFALDLSCHLFFISYGHLH